MTLTRSLTLLPCSLPPIERKQFIPTICIVYDQLSYRYTTLHSSAGDGFLHGEIPTVLSWSMAFTLLFLSDLGKVNLGRVYMPAEVYCLFKVLWRWVMALNDYLDALLQGYCSAPASKQARSCLFEFSILYCHMSFACLQLMLGDWSFPSAILLPRARSTHTHSPEALLWKGDSEKEIPRVRGSVRNFLTQAQP